MSETHHVATYPVEEQYENWQDHAEEMQVSMSQYVENMVEAGRKKFTREIETDITKEEIRDQRDDLRKELQRTRARVEQLEEMVHRGERGAILEFVEDNPGATDAEILTHVSNTANTRVPKLLADLEAMELEFEDGGYYRVDNHE